MIRSMTAYAIAERATDGGTLACEVRAVNHRFLELGLRLPEELRVLEPALRERISARIARGKLDFSLRLRSPEGEGAIRVNQELITQLAAVAKELDAHFPQLRAEFVDLLQYPGVLQSKSVDAEALQAHAMALLDTLLDQFNAFLDAYAQGDEERYRDAVPSEFLPPVQLEALKLMQGKQSPVNQVQDVINAGHLDGRRH